MRRAVLAAFLAAALGVLTACSGSHPPSFAGGTSLKVSTPELADVKKQTDVPNCPKVAHTSVSGGMPAVTVPCLGGGRPVDLAGLRGPMIVNFWQAYCGPCRKEMPALAAFARHHPGVKVLGVDYLDMQPAAALALAGKSNVSYPLVADPNGDLTGKAPLTRIPGLPFTAYVAASGRVVHVEAVPMTSEQEFAAAARQYLGTAG